MATYQTSGSSLLNDIIPQMKQFRATTGRDMSPQIIQGLLQAKIKEENANANVARSLDLQQTRDANSANIANQTLKINQRNQVVSEIGQAGSLVGAGAKGYEALTKPGGLLGPTAPVTAPTAGASSADIVAAGNLTAPGPLVSPGTVAPATAAAGAGVTGAIPATAQTAAEAAGAGVPSMAPAAAEQVAAEFGQSAIPAATASETGLLGAASSFAAPVSAGLLGGQVGEILGQKIGHRIGVGGQQERKIGGGIAGGAMAGAAVGSVIPVVGTVIGGVVGGIVGGIASLF